jgi:hypothetical protein
MIYKKYLFIHFITIAAFLLLGKDSFSQKMFYPGFVVTNEGDTIKGRIPFDIGTNNNYHVVDLKDEKGFVKKFNVWQIKMYSINNEKYFTKKCERGEMKHRNELVFMHQLQVGKLLLYEYEFVRKIGAARNFGDAGLEPEGERDFYVEKRDGSFVYLPRLNYKNVLRELISGKPECIAIIEQKEFEYLKIPEAISCFNQL